ncbi:MAG: class I adenylate-forming enzyme family protein [Acidimicrobiales bacterium]
MSVLGTAVIGAAKRFGDRPVVMAPDGTLTYAELDRASAALASELTARGVGEGDVVAAILPSGGDWVVIAAAVARAGAVMAGISPVATPPERAVLLDLVRPKVVLASPDSVDGLPLRTTVAVLEPGSRGAEISDALHIADVPSDDDAPTPAEPVDAPSDDDRPSMVCFTSGTTGRPKAALFRERQLRAISLIDLGPGWEEIWDGGGPMLASTQFAHVGMALKLPWYVRRGVTLHVMERWRPEPALRLVAETGMTTIGVVAPQLALMLRSPLVDELDLSAVQAVIAGGAASPPALVREAKERLGVGYSIRYSSTESGGVGIGTAFDAPDAEMFHTVGRPRPGVEIRIVTDDGLDAEPDVVGELRLRSPAMMDSYLGDPDATAATFDEQGFLRTGDLARWSTEPGAEGCIALAGRRTDMYIRGGYNVFPLEVESALGDHPALAGIGIVARPDPTMGEIGVAAIVANDPGTAPTLEELRAHGAERLARHKLPEALVVVDALPLTAAQKLDRAALAEMISSVL